MFISPIISYSVVWPFQVEAPEYTRSPSFCLGHKTSPSPSIRRPSWSALPQEIQGLLYLGADLVPWRFSARIYSMSMFWRFLILPVCLFVLQMDAPLVWRGFKSWGRGTWWSQMFPCSTRGCMCAPPTGLAPEWGVLHSGDLWYKVRPYRLLTYLSKIVWFC